MNFNTHEMSSGNSGNVYDFIIIGAGAAGLQLAIGMHTDPYFSDKKILLLEKSNKSVNDRTWCFWEQGSGQWDHIVFKSWDSGVFNSGDEQLPLSMYPYRYKMIRAIDFYNNAREIFSHPGPVQWRNFDVTDVAEAGLCMVKSGDDCIYSRHVFDSRIDAAFYNNHQQSIQILQHFKGWEIESPHEVFNSESFVIMDFSVRWKNTTGFTYILPFTNKSALVEFTLFTSEVIGDGDYESMLKIYLSEQLRLSDYKITAVEHGVIPMSDYNFREHHSPCITKIGTAGGWVKPSSGYSFRNAQKYSARIIDNMKRGAEIDSGIATGRHRKYDTLFLDILYRHNDLGPEIFTAMYSKNRTSQIFKFLDEETSLLEDLQIIRNFESKPFRDALRRNWRKVLFNQVAGL